MLQAVLIGALVVAALAAAALSFGLRARRAPARRAGVAAPPARPRHEAAPPARPRHEAAPPARRIPVAAKPAGRAHQAATPVRRVTSTPAPVGMHVVRTLALDLDRCLTTPQVEVLPRSVGGDPRQLAEARAAVQAVGEALAARRELLGGLSRIGQDPGELTALIQSDPDVARRVLARTNGPEYQLDTPIEQVTRAVMFLGHTEVRLQAWWACFDDVIRPSSSMTAGAFERQWQHAFTVARTTQALCANVGLVRSQTAVTAAFLHDLGKLLALARWPDRARAFDDVRFSTGPILASEIARLGISHPQLGADLCEVLGLPAEIGRVVLRHHVPSYAPPEDADVQPVVLATVYLANLLNHAVQAHLTGHTCAGVHPPAAGWLELLKAESLDDLLAQNVVLALLDPAVAWRGAPDMKGAA